MGMGCPILLRRYLLRYRMPLQLAAHLEVGPLCSRGSIPTDRFLGFRIFNSAYEDDLQQGFKVRFTLWSRCNKKVIIITLKSTVISN